MSERFEDDGLDGDLARMIAQGTAHSGQLIDSLMRRLQGSYRDEETAQRTAAEQAQAQHLQMNQEQLNQEQRRVEEQTDQRLAERIGLDPRRVGDRRHVDQWVDTADPALVSESLAAAQRHAEESAGAARLRDSLHARIRDYGVDPERLAGSSPAAVAAELEHARAQFHGLGHGGVEDPNVDRDASEVHSLMNRADMADRDASASAAAADRSLGEAQVASRSERVGQVQATSVPAKTAAATAARDHPTNPATAARGAAKQAPKARKSGPNVQRERAHTGR